ncbi:MAG: hypothetical protein RR621_03455 [Lachnospiraceae bacterium]
MNRKTEVHVNGLMKICILNGWKDYLFIIVLVFINCKIFQSRVVGYGEAIGEPLQIKMGDYLFDLYKGIEPYIQTLGSESFKIPGIWSFYYIFFLCIQALAFARCYQRSQQFLLRYVTRKKWWQLLNRILICNVILIYILTYVTIFIFCICLNVKFGWPNGKVQWLLNQLELQGIQHYEMLIYGVLLPVLATILLTYVQYIITLFWNNLMGVVFGVVLLVGSCFFCYHGLLGNYMMIIRNQYLLSAKSDIIISILVCLGGSVICAQIGKKRIEILDFYS